MLYDYEKKTFERIQTLPQGFYLSYDNDGNVVLSIKAVAGVVTSIVKGCQITLYLIKDEKLTTLYIMDNPQMPLYFKGVNFSGLDNEFPDFEKVVMDLIKAERFTLVLMNEANYQIANSKINKVNSINIFKKWLEENEQVFEITLSNISLSTENMPMYIDSFQNKIWDNKLIDNKAYFKFDEYTRDGKHGYHQEFSFRNILSLYYQPNKELFHSIKKSNGEEFTDFVVIYEKAIVLIESKYTISSKQTMFNKAINKAVRQLTNAEKIAIEQPNSIADSKVRQGLSNFEVLLKICIFYDDGRDLSNSFKNISTNYPPQTLPLFISIDIFYQFASYLQIHNENYKYYIIKNLLKIRADY
ncbi:hypothetical protein [Flavobacterium collinsii]|uniref:Anti-bacteriophage protein A/HamA C-terminal domain-containing protein n=1 Tax=Flavobacterium collinsii TaxID=1114861 RepID=A0ABM8KMG3_9FLAO|nr:hypothetical protein [Flavobacterium collinsii]CAA9200982.1 hypothetical protein FLACOL7796_03548 [Flavobacterium collinsii]